MKKLPALICIFSLAFSQLGFSQTAPVVLPVTTKVFGLLELRDAVNSKDEDKWRELAYSQAPTNALSTTIDMYYGAMLLGAFKINDLARIDAIAKLWEDAKTGSPSPLQVRFAVLSQGTGNQLEEAMQLGTDYVTRAMNGPASKIGSRADLANLYLSVGEFTKADALLDEAAVVMQGDLARMGLSGFWALYSPLAKGKYFQTRCNQQTLLFQYEKAEQSCLQAIGHQKDALGYYRMGNPFEQLGLTSYHIQTYAKLAEIYSKKDRFFDAESMIRSANDVFAKYPAFGVVQALILEGKIHLSIARKDATQYDALLLEGLSFRTKFKFQMAEQSLAAVILHRYQQTAMVMGER